MQPLLRTRHAPRTLLSLRSFHSSRSATRKYPSAFAAYGIIARAEGVKGLWTGVGPNIGRNAIINAAELASYDQARRVSAPGGPRLATLT